jgi:hypothetical protein
VRTYTACESRVELPPLIVQVSRRTSVQPEGVEMSPAPPKRTATVATRTSPATTPAGRATVSEEDVVDAVLVETGDGAASAVGASRIAARIAAAASSVRAATREAAPTWSLLRFVR